MMWYIERMHVHWSHTSCHASVYRSLEVALHFSSFRPITVNLTVSFGYSTADSSLQLNYNSTANYYTIQLAYIA